MGHHKSHNHGTHAVFHEISRISNGTYVYVPHTAFRFPVPHGLRRVVYHLLSKTLKTQRRDPIAGHWVRLKSYLAMAQQVYDQILVKQDEALHFFQK